MNELGISPENLFGSDRNFLATPPKFTSIAEEGVDKSSTMIDTIQESNWGTEISPIAKSRESDVGMSLIDGPYEDPTTNGDGSPSLSDLEMMISANSIERLSIKQDSRKKLSSSPRSSNVSRMRGFDAEQAYRSDRRLSVPSTTQNKIPGKRNLSAGCDRRQGRKDDLNLSGLFLEPERRERQDSRVSYHSNKSMLSDNTDTYTPSTDISMVKRQVGQSSSDFIERIRSAAHRRKVAMTRSRDSLVAKEKEQLKNLAALGQNHADDDNSDQSSDESDISVEEQLVQQKKFRARPVPTSTGIGGMGGMTGVPKVTKKPVTMPNSPLLGSRRPQKAKIRALEQPKVLPKSKAPISSRKRSVKAPQPSNGPPVEPFKARPVPASVGRRGFGGLSGIPKVPKRPLTVPHSPLLGPRRRPQRDAGEVNRHVRPTRSPTETQQGKSTIQHPRGVPVSWTSTKVQDVAQSPVLLGLEFLGNNQEEQEEEVEEYNCGRNDENLAPKGTNIKPYIPHSTKRAKKRAVFDTQRDELYRQKLQDNQNSRNRQIRQVQRELEILRKSL